MNNNSPAQPVPLSTKGAMPRLWNALIYISRLSLLAEILK